MTIDTSTPEGARADERLRSELVAWLITVAADGTPLPTPVWFLWDGSSIVVYSQPDTPKLRHIGGGGRVALALRTDPLGDEITVISGDAVVDGSLPPADRLPGYVDRYAALIERLGADPTSFASAYSVPIRITPTKLRQWSVDTG